MSGQNKYQGRIFAGPPQREPLTEEQLEALREGNPNFDRPLLLNAEEEAPPPAPPPPSQEELYRGSLLSSSRITLSLP